MNCILPSFSFVSVSDVGMSMYVELMLIMAVLMCFRSISVSFNFRIHLLGLCMSVCLFLSPIISLKAPDHLWVCCIRLWVLLCVILFCGLVSFGSASYFFLWPFFDFICIELNTRIHVSQLKTSARVHESCDK